jgi:hypothetical protein
MACSHQARPSQPGPVATLLLFLGCQSLAGFILGLLQWGRALAPTATVRAITASPSVATSERAWPPDTQSPMWGEDFPGPFSTRAVAVAILITGSSAPPSVISSSVDSILLWEVHRRYEEEVPR